MAFETFGIVSNAVTGTAPSIFVASTADDLAAITTAGYLTYLGDQVKQNDIIFVNYDDLSTQPLSPSGLVATLGEFYVNFVADVPTLVAIPSAALGTASGKDASDNTKSVVASVDGVAGSYVVGNLLQAGDTNGSVGADSGYNIANNGLLYASVAITAAQWNGMYAAPKLLVAAPGANKMIVVEAIELVMTFVSANYAAGNTLAAQYDSTINGAGVLATTTLAAGSVTGAGASTVLKLNAGAVAAPFTTCANKGLYLSNVTAAFTTGDSTWVAKVHYRVIDTV